MKKQIIIMLFIFVFGIKGLCDELDREAVATLEVTKYVQEWTKDLPDKRRLKIFSYIPYVVEHSLKRDLDPLLICEIISKEGGWDIKAIGKRGEIGLMQTMCEANLKAFKEGYDMSTAEGQIVAGTTHLKDWIDKSETLEQAWTGYASGNNKLKWSKLEFRMREYRKAIDKFRDVSNEEDDGNIEYESRE